MSSSSHPREAAQPMSSEHRRPLFAFVAVFVVAMLVVAGAARSEALREFAQERTVAIVAATALDLVGEPEPRSVVPPPVVDTSGTEPVSPAPQAGVAKDKAATGDAARKGPSAAPGQSKGHAHAKAPGRAKGHTPGATPGKGSATGQGKAKGGQQRQGHDRGKGHSKGQGKHGR